VLGSGGLIAAGLLATLGLVTLGIEKLGNKIADLGKKALGLQTLQRETGMSQPGIRAFRQTNKILGDISEQSTDAGIRNLGQKKLEIERGQFQGGADVQSWLLSKGFTQEKTKGMSTDEFDQQLISEVLKTKDIRLQAKIFDALGISDWKSLIGKSPEEYNKLYGKQRKEAEGLNLEKGNESLNRFREAWEKLAASFDNLGTRVFNTLLIPVVDRLTTAVEKFTGFVDGLSNKFQTVADAIGGEVDKITALFDSQYKIFYDHLIKPVGDAFEWLANKVQGVLESLGLTGRHHGGPKNGPHGAAPGAPGAPGAMPPPSNTGQTTSTGKNPHPNVAPGAPGVMPPSNTAPTTSTGKNPHRASPAGVNAAPVALHPATATSTLGVTPEQYGAFREGMAHLESHSKYDIKGGSSGRFSGRYQLGAQEIADTARNLGEPAPSREQFLKDPAMQERFFEKYTLDHHNYLMKHSGKYRAMTPEQQLEALGYAHNQGAGGAAKWLRSGQVGRDAFGTAGTAYPDEIHRRLAQLKQTQVANAKADNDNQGGGKMQAQLDVNFANAPAGMTSGLKVISGDPKVQLKTQRAMYDLGGVAA
jgi:hypothetical protein